MSLVNRELRDVWRSLRASGVERRFGLYDVRIRNLRGIRDLRITFDYPVSVLAGPNGCGKSTVLFACACAYRVPGRGPWEFAPATLFPHFAGGESTALADAVDPTELEFYYLHDAERLSMLWRRNKSWTRSFMGRRGGRQPQRPLYLRRFSGHAYPRAEQRANPAGTAAEVTDLSPELLIFAHRILPLRYRRLSLFRMRTPRPAVRGRRRAGRRQLLRVPHVVRRAHDPPHVEGPLRARGRARPHRRGGDRPPSAHPAAGDAGAAAPRAPPAPAGHRGVAQRRRAEQRAAGRPHRARPRALARRRPPPARLSRRRAAVALRAVESTACQSCARTTSPRG